MYAATQQPLTERRRTQWCPGFAAGSAPGTAPGTGPTRAPPAPPVAAPITCAVSPAPASPFEPADVPSESRALRLSIETAVAYSLGIEPELLGFPSRGRAPVSQARQISMYLAHVCFSLSLTQVGQMFDRDRTTVAHACEITEQRRDDAVFDLFVTRLELLVRIMCGRPGATRGVTTPPPRSGSPRHHSSGVA